MEIEAVKERIVTVRISERGRGRRMEGGKEKKTRKGLPPSHLRPFLQRKKQKERKKPND